MTIESRHGQNGASIEAPVQTLRVFTPEIRAVLNDSYWIYRKTPEGNWTRRFRGTGFEGERNFEVAVMSAKAARSARNPGSGVSVVTAEQLELDESVYSLVAKTRKDLALFSNHIQITDSNEPGLEGLAATWLHAVWGSDPSAVKNIVIAPVIIPTQK